MSVAETIADAVSALPPEYQREVFDFVAFLESKTRRKLPLRSPAGLWTDLNIRISAEEIDEDRKEMWGKFPREDI